MAYTPPPTPPSPTGSGVPAATRWYRKPGPVFLVVLMVACAIAIPVMFVLLGSDDGGGAAGTSTAAEFTTMAESTSVVTATTAPDQSPSTTDVPPTPEELAAAEFEADVLLIQYLWQGYSASWSGGLQTGAQYIAAHNYPGFPCSAGDWWAYYRDELGWQDGDGEEVAVHAGTIERQDDWDWVIPASYPNAGERPQGRIYTMTVDSTTRVAGAAESHAWDIHATVIGSSAYFFFECE